jgi:hypothetical protein
VVPARRRVGLIGLCIVLGLVIGSFLGEFLAASLPDGWARAILTRGPTIGLIPPATVDLRPVSVTLGFAVKVNLVGVLGIVLAAVVMRRW